MEREARAQYEHVKDGLEDRGRSGEQAAQIAARTVTKERARAGEAEESSRLSREDMPASRRGGRHSHQGSGGRTRDQLSNEARAKNLKGRSSMTTAELERAVGR